MLHRLVLKLRHRAYDSGRKKSSAAAIPTVCVGNVTVGGTGKTPHTEMLLRLLGQEWPELHAAVLSRGYGRKTKGFLNVNPDGRASDYGDEPLQIARKFPQVKVAVDEDRIEGCLKLKESGAELAILDDAFQYRRLTADFNIVLVDFHRPVFQDRLIPFGRLRDIPERLFASDAVIVTKCPETLVDADKGDFAVKLHLSDYNPSTSTARTPDGRTVLLLFTLIRYMPAVPAFPDGEHRYVFSKQAVLFSGIAGDAPLMRYLKGRYRLMKHFRFPDHHVFRKSDLAHLADALREFPIAGFFTTEKDVSRLAGRDDIPTTLRKRLLAVPIEVEFSTPQEQEALVSGLCRHLNLSVGPVR